MMQTNIIITAGPMRAWIDDVRFITNASSGKMGYALYEEAINMGFPTTLIMGKVPYIEDKLRDRNDVIFVETNDELFEAIKNEIRDNTLLIMAAAPLDFIPSEKKTGKIKKDNQDNITITLIKARDILKDIGEYVKRKRYKNVYLVGFSAEYEQQIENARKKLIQKSLFAIILNDISRKDIGFFSDYNEVYILYKDGTIEKIGKGLKKEVARKILKSIFYKISAK